LITFFLDTLHFGVEAIYDTSDNLRRHLKTTRHKLHKALHWAEEVRLSQLQSQLLSQLLSHLLITEIVMGIMIML